VSQHILFVDDEAPIREMLSLFFKKKGFSVTGVVSGGEAMELVDQVPFDMVILDVNLAGENGLELLGFFKTNYPELPVVMFSGMSSDRQLLEESLARGANGFMSKNDSLDELYSEVRRHLPAPATAA
jgi:DNA-binding response OmpR family regulator